MFYFFLKKVEIFVPFLKLPSLIIKHCHLRYTIENIIENPLFYKWVFNPTSELDLYWAHYIKKHPVDENLILELKSSIRNLELNNNKLREAEKLELALKISKRLDKEDQKVKKKSQVLGFIKYAAVAIIFFSIGAMFVYTNIEKEDLGKYISEMEIPKSFNSPMLILPEGKSIAINDGESTLDYSQSGEIMLNKDSIIQAVQPSKINQLVMPHGSSSKVVLSDGSVVWLNAGSSLVYPSTFTNKSREVVLFGEAYFKVAKNQEKPFLVQTSALEIKVLGTEFNVSAYPEDNVIQTVLKEGSVALRRIGAPKTEKYIILKPNQLASFDKSTQLSSITYVNTDFYTLWIDGLLCFENLDFNRVIRKVERFYDINIQLEDPLSGSVHISGKLDLKQNKDEVLEYLSLVSMTKFSQVNEKNYVIK